MNEQIIEVEYDKALVEQYQKEYIMEEEGIGADLDTEPSDTQTNINNIPLAEMIDPREVIIEEADYSD